MIDNIKKLKESKGFTLIEVVVVMAIAALIILVVLQAVASAQRGQRDSARRQEAGQIAAALEQYAANNQGKYPANPGAAQTAMVDYLPEFDSGGTYKYSFVAADGGYISAPTPVTHNCNPTGSGKYEIAYAVAANDRDFRVAVCIESANSTVTIR